MPSISRGRGEWSRGGGGVEACSLTEVDVDAALEQTAQDLDDLLPRHA